jgi:hypothetical protein
MRKRSKYKPKGVRLDATTYVLNGFRLVSTTGSAALDLKIKNHSALEALRTGQAKRYDLDSIISTLNVSEALSRLGIGHEYTDEIREGQDALLELSRRGINREDRFVAKASELTAINYVMELHDAQLDITTIAQLEKALDIVTNEIKSRKARVIEEKTA